MAQELWRVLADVQASPLHVASTEVVRLCNEGDALLFSKQYPQALEKYDAALRLDPLYSQAAVFAGDVFYGQKQWPEAEARFRQGVTIEPLNAQGWRFLSDALQAQGKTAEADKALLAGIAAQPSQLPNWDKLGVMRGRAGLPLTPLKLRMLAQAHLDPDTHKPVVNLDGALRSDAATPDRAIWIAYGIAKANALTEAQKSGQTPAPFALELGAWKKAMAVADEMEGKGPPLAEPDLLALQKLSRAGQLEPAILILAYRESYRPDWESWKAAHPNGVAAFIDNYGLRP
jgi:tetratricopeptide (TPR) repeat protein